MKRRIRIVCCLLLLSTLALAGPYEDGDADEQVMAFDGGRFVLRHAPSGECVIALQGRVNRTTNFKFDDVVSRAAAIGCIKPWMMLLESPGGLLYDGLSLGQQVRTQGLRTTARYECASACALIFLGGVERVLWGSRARIGFHQAATVRGRTKWCDLALDDPGVIRMRRYLRSVVPDNADRIMGLIMQTSCDSIEWVDGQRAVELGVATKLEAEGVDVFGPRSRR